LKEGTPKNIVIRRKKYVDHLGYYITRNFVTCTGNFSLFTTVSRPAVWSSQVYIQWVPGIRTPGVKRPRHEADHSRPSSAEVKNACSYTSAPPIGLHGVVLS